MSTQDSDILTYHALLVLQGQFARSIGLVDGLMQVPLGQKTYVYCPQTKVMEFFVGMLAGLVYLKIESSCPSARSGYSRRTGVEAARLGRLQRASAAPCRR